MHSGIANRCLWIIIKMLTSWNLIPDENKRLGRTSVSEGMNKKFYDEPALCANIKSEGFYEDYSRC
jgi:hypothetical protein